MSKRCWILVLIIFFSSCYVSCSDKPMTYPQALKESTALLEAAKQTIITYYSSCDGEYSDFEKEIQLICEEYLPSFQHVVTEYKSKHNKNQPAVIFDIDETLLSNFMLRVETNFSSAPGGDANYEFRDKLRCTAIKPMVAFCKQLRESGYKLIFISARRGKPDHVIATRQNLEKEGYLVDSEDGLFLKTMDVYHTPTKDWKESVRKMLSTKYEILGCVGDSDVDITGEQIGKVQVKIPNYLY